MYYESTYLAHHGVLGMKWGVRRYQNPDGSLTPKGRKRYANDGSEEKGNSESSTKSSSGKGKTALKIGVAVAGTALAAYGAYKVYQIKNDPKLIASMDKAKAAYDDFNKNYGKQLLEDADKYGQQYGRLSKAAYDYRRAGDHSMAKDADFLARRSLEQQMDTYKRHSQMQYELNRRRRETANKAQGAVKRQRARNNRRELLRYLRGQSSSYSTSHK